MQRNWIMFPPVTLQTLPKSLQRLFDRVPSRSPDQPVVNGSCSSMRNKIIKHFTQLQSLPQVGLKNVLKTLSHNCLSAVGNPIIHISHNGRPRQKEIKTGFLEEPPGGYVMVCAYFSVSTSVLEEMYNSASGNQFLQHSNKIHQGRIVAYHHTINSFEKPNICDFHKIRQIANQVSKYPEVLTLSCLL